MALFFGQAYCRGVIRPILDSQSQEKKENEFRRQGFGAELMMENVARDVADLICANAPRVVVIMAGPGNNGADGLAVARHVVLRMSTQVVTSIQKVVIWEWPSRSKSSLYRKQRQFLNFFSHDRLLKKKKTSSVRKATQVHPIAIEFCPTLSRLQNVLKRECDELRNGSKGSVIFLDALFGVGYQSRKVPSQWKRFQSWFHEFRTQMTPRDSASRDAAGIALWALDQASGLDGNGIWDPSFHGWGADRSLCVMGPKLCQIMGDGPRASGQLAMVDVGTPVLSFPLSLDSSKAKGGRSLRSSGRAHVYFLDVADCRGFATQIGNTWGIESREIPIGAHKNQRGRILVLGGSFKHGGAPGLVAEGAFANGAGYVTAIDALADELRVSELVGVRNQRRKWAQRRWGRWVVDAPSSEWDSVVKNHDVLVFGPGIRGVPKNRAHAAEFEEELRMARSFLEYLGQVKAPLRVVVDGGAFLFLTELERIWRVSNSIEWILTPHPGEAERMAKYWNLAYRNRAELAHVLTQKLSRLGVCGTLLLKGAYPWVCALGPQSFNLVVNYTGDRDSQAGSGDRLAGLLAAQWTRFVWPRSLITRTARPARNRSARAGSSLMSVLNQFAESV